MPLFLFTLSDRESLWDFSSGDKITGQFVFEIKSIRDLLPTDHTSCGNLDFFSAHLVFYLWTLGFLCSL